MRHRVANHPRSFRGPAAGLMLALIVAVAGCDDRNPTEPADIGDIPAASLGLDESATAPVEAALTGTSETTRLPRSFFVDPRLGNDANAGTRLKPFKTLAHGLGIAIAGDTFRLASGVYSKAANGEKFSTSTTQVTVPAGVTIIGTLAEDFTTRLQGGTGDTYGLDLKGNATLRNLIVSNFPAAIRATSGSQALKTIVLEQNLLGLDLRGTAKATLTGNSKVFLTSPIGLSGLVTGANLGQQAQLTVVGGAFSGAGQNCRTATQGIVLHDVSRATIQGGAVLKDIAGTALVLSAKSKAAVVRSSIERDFSLLGGCTPLASVVTQDSAVFTLAKSRLESTGGITSVGIKSDSRALLTLDSAKVHGHTGAGIRAFTLPKIVVKPGTVITSNNIGIDVVATGGNPLAITSSLIVTGAIVTQNDIGIRGPFLKLRGSNVSFNGTGVAVVNAVLIADLGLPSTPGKNVFKGNSITGVSLKPFFDNFVSVNAVGNTWNPGIQDADGSGHYQSPTTVSGPNQGTNYQIPFNTDISL